MAARLLQFDSAVPSSHAQRRLAVRCAAATARGESSSPAPTPPAALLLRFACVANGSPVFPYLVVQLISACTLWICLLHSLFLFLSSCTFDSLPVRLRSLPVLSSPPLGAPSLEEGFQTRRGRHVRWFLALQFLSMHPRQLSNPFLVCIDPPGTDNRRVLIPAATPTQSSVGDGKRPSPDALACPPRAITNCLSSTAAQLGTRH